MQGLRWTGPESRRPSGSHGEEDEFRFQVARKGQYIIETEGPTDVVMALFGPDDPKHLAATDDDSGRNWNARIAVPLESGEYYIRIRHYCPSGTGGYRVRLKSDR